MSTWSSWVGPDASGTLYRYRHVARPSMNGGEKCDDLIELKKGKVLDNV